MIIRNSDYIPREPKDGRETFDTLNQQSERRSARVPPDYAAEEEKMMRDDSVEGARETIVRTFDRDRSPRWKDRLSEQGYRMVPELYAYAPRPIDDREPATSEFHDLEITGVMGSIYTGKGVKVAILDSGLYSKHRDFVGRPFQYANFVDYEEFDDTYGHGTHCTGKACGRLDNRKKRYGVATDALIYHAKVLDGYGRGRQEWVIKGVEWAIREGCKVISMSLGSSSKDYQGGDAAYEEVARRAMQAGAVVLAAAGNDSNRDGKTILPLCTPANCPSVVAVAAINEDGKVANFSNRALPGGGNIDIAAPGTKMYSSWHTEVNYFLKSGTSMATALAAGITAMLWEKYPKATAYEIRDMLISEVMPLPGQDVRDVGRGMCLAPDASPRTAHSEAT